MWRAEVTWTNLGKRTMILNIGSSIWPIHVRSLPLAGPAWSHEGSSSAILFSFFLFFCNTNARIHAFPSSSSSSSSSLSSSPKCLRQGTLQNVLITTTRDGVARVWQESRLFHLRGESLQFNVTCSLSVRHFDGRLEAVRDAQFEHFLCSVRCTGLVCHSWSTGHGSLRTLWFRVLFFNTNLRHHFLIFIPAIQLFLFSTKPAKKYFYFSWSFLVCLLRCMPWFETQQNCACLWILFFTLFLLMSIGIFLIRFLVAGLASVHWNREKWAVCCCVLHFGRSRRHSWLQYSAFVTLAADCTSLEWCFSSFPVPLVFFVFFLVYFVLLTMDRHQGDARSFTCSLLHFSNLWRYIPRLVVLDSPSIPVHDAITTRFFLETQKYWQVGRFYALFLFCLFVCSSQELILKRQHTLRMWICIFCSMMVCLRPPPCLLHQLHTHKVCLTISSSSRFDWELDDWCPRWEHWGD